MEKDLSPDSPRAHNQADLFLEGLFPPLTTATVPPSPISRPGRIGEPSRGDLERCSALLEFVWEEASSMVLRDDYNSIMSTSSRQALRDTAALARVISCAATTMNVPLEQLLDRLILSALRDVVALSNDGAGE